jgi:chloramphenicol O-acetyltransferase
MSDLSNTDQSVDGGGIIFTDGGKGSVYLDTSSLLHFESEGLNVGGTVLAKDYIKEEGKTFYTIRIPWIEDYKEFYRNTRQLIDNIPHDRDPYETDKEVTRVGDFDVINLSAVPGLYFTSVVYTKFGVGHAQDYPLMNVGKAIVRGDRRVMPISWTVSHEFIDGPHNARFMQLVQQFLDEKV